MTEKNAFATLLDSIAQKKQEKDIQMNDGVKGTLPLPASQDIQPDHIKWEWTNAHVPITAYFAKDDSSYYIEIDGVTIDADHAKTLGEVLLSAARWRDIWQANAGLYLAYDGRLQASPDKGPDDEPDHADTL